jgi:hypothetical protein
MWSRIKTVYNYIFKVCLALAVIFFMIMVFFTLAFKQLNENTHVMNFISLVTVVLSMPSVIDSLAKEFNPKKKVYKLSCKCPNCRHLIEMNMKEE